MATKNQICKVGVQNSLSMFNTVGQELQSIFLANEINDAEKQMGIKNLSQKERLTDRQIDKACRITGMGNELKSFLINFQEEYQKDKSQCMLRYKAACKNFTQLKKILPLLRNEFNNGIDLLDDILDYFNVDSEEEIFADSEKVAVFFREQNNTEVDPINLKAWLRRGELDFQQMVLPRYDEDAFFKWIESYEWKQEIENVNYFMELPQKLARYGVALIYVPFLPKTVYGSVRWINGHPLIEISDRNRDLATCWFTLFHEFGHVIKHKNIEVLEGEINESKSKKNKRETEANKFANHYLFNGDGLRKEVFLNKRMGNCMNAKYLSDKYNVNSILVSYWLLKAQYQPEFQRKIHIDFISAYQ